MADASAVNLAYAIPIILGSGVVSAMVAGIFTIVTKRMDHKAEIAKKKIENAEKKEFDVEKEIREIKTLLGKMHIAQSATMEDRIKYLCLRFIDENAITGEELKDLLKLHEKYQTALDGNGLLDTLITQVKALKIVRRKTPRHETKVDMPKMPELPKMPDEKPLILVVDDSTTWTYVVEKALGTVKYNIQKSHEPKEVKTLLQQITPNLIILDCNMPEISGLQLIPVIRAFPKLKNTPIIMLTGDETPETLNSATDLGVSEFLLKKRASSELRDIVEHYLH